MAIRAENMEAYFDSIQFSDWTHALSRAPMLKAQHPDYELYMTGIHAERGVSCADCHMPYKREGGLKFTNHHLQSPLNNISGSCQVCHRESEETLRQNVYDRQDKVASSGAGPKKPCQASPGGKGCLGCRCYGRGYGGRSCSLSGIRSGDGTGWLPPTAWVFTPLQNL
jgi:hypothetical protein